ncbi:Putative oligopeptide ABC transporter, ATP-binding protein [Mycobacteroides abscessus subsp. abscessus]|uniref:Oligopeptide ABC transporter,ATP-binding protein n=1 Tax=Mycobacteroides abscessus (strain ATCC 19977 / DSM 44196 / CCUG 20993 / CIP 104536 / JCM 13569 / NCTC 13031 / TMC 1543 / L948) TaxID=561007 RepID=B1MFX8_MYCA9|nr:peptide ABC transporter ATPase [Mycobacteroides abscessus V06705]OTR07838.1 ABC transporter ATP-binding protein [Mycobacteroides abscessus]RTZ50855.1 ABC transporter ATP-binding protein [Mycobacteroides abscessus subsp. abscessus]CAM60528.1 Putative oligopeptide ABC transporter,ATP-binding protein [Mycobacteroides abscessus ATCC 19977]OTR33328.1 ABC transporter ATP-binding protein [Mycobacteroides abscessus]
MEVPTSDSVVDITGLTVDFEVDKQWVPAVKGVSLSVAKGEVLAIVGESGSGKSTTAMAIPALLPPSARVRGSVKLNGAELLGATNDELRAVRGKDVAVIFQEPMTALNPVYTIGWQIAEAVCAHKKMSRRQARDRAVELLDLVDMPEPAKRVKHYPHQLSGGQRQRAMIAQALALDPGLLIADEPTTALDVTVQAEILDLMRDLRHRIDAGIILITHDMGVVADMADRIMVMKDGEVVEQGDAEGIFHRAQQPYTRQLLASVPHLGATLHGRDESNPPPTDLALSVEHAVIEYPGKSGSFRAVDDVSFTIGRGEVVGLVGESGSGKSTIGRAAVGLLRVASGTICVAGQDISTANRKQLRDIRSKVGVVFQDPGSSLNPRWPIGQSIAEPLTLHTDMDRTQREGRVKTLLEQVQLPAAMRNRFPHQLSGGQRQRVGIARALALEPTLLIADEPTSALDVSVQATVLDLFAELQREHGFACLFISHDLAVVELVASRIAVLNRGRLAEFGSDTQVLTAPKDDYTKRLLAAVPVPDPEQQRIRREERQALR